MITQKFDYYKPKRVEENGVRHYALPDGSKVPSVTTILDKTKSEEQKQALANWRKRVGEKRAQEITTEAAGRGTRMHKYLEDFVLDDVLKDAGSNPYSQQSRRMAQKIIEEGLVNVNEYWGTEVPVYFPGLYAGTTDCLGLWKGKPAIIDFKQTNKPKKTEWIIDYFTQLCAYGNAHNEVHGTNIRTGVILMAAAPASVDDPVVYQEWVIEDEVWDHFSELWSERVRRYYDKY